MGGGPRSDEDGAADVAVDEVQQCLGAGALVGSTPLICWDVREIAFLVDLLCPVFHFLGG